MNLIKKYDFSSLIFQEDIDAYIECIDEIFERDGNREHPGEPIYVPSFQTKPNLFHQELFHKLRNSFVFSCSSYLNTALTGVDFKAWCYMDYYDNWKTKDIEELWHDHIDDLDAHCYEGKQKLSGIFYLRVPKDDLSYDYASTEFKDNDDIYHEKFTWFVYPSDLVHRPGKVLSNKKRYCIAADIYFDPLDACE
jgi:hypothetical protein